MATLDELVLTVADVKTAVAKIGPAVDALEAKVTAALATTGISAVDQLKIDTAFADLKGIGDQVNAAVADAGDGVDEAAAGAASTGTGPT